MGYPIRRAAKVTVKLILKVIHRTLKKTGLSNKWTKCFNVGTGSKTLFDRNNEIGKMKTTARKKILGIMKNSPNSVGTLEDRILVYHLFVVGLEWVGIAKLCANKNSKVLHFKHLQRKTNSFWQLKQFVVYLSLFKFTKIKYFI